ncbi:MAG: DNA polymerase III subunit delta [Nocardioidaceae bacterium]
MTAAAAPILGTVTLVTGNAEYLSARTVARALAAVARADPDSDTTVVAAPDLASAALGQMTSPSLFATTRALVVNDLHEVGDDLADTLVTYAAAPADDVALILVHPGGNKGRGLLEKLRKLPAVHEVKSDVPKEWDLPRFVTGEVRHHGGSIDDDAAAFLVEAVGKDLRSLAGAADQLVADFAPARLSVEIVRRYFDGRAEVKSFDIADAAIGGKVAEALEGLRWAIGNGVPAVLITSAFASGLRSLARLSAAPRGLREVDLAREIGAPPFRIKALRAQLKSWQLDGLARAILAVAQADLDVKGGSGDSDHALERMVLAVVRARA